MKELVLYQGFSMCPKMNLRVKTGLGEIVEMMIIVMMMIVIMMIAMMMIEFDDEEEETPDDEYVHTPEHYVPTEEDTNDESNDVTEEEYEIINEELYGDVNVNQEGASNQFKDDSHETQNIKGPILSSSISSGYSARNLNFDNIPSVDSEIVSMLDIKFQHEVPRLTSSHHPKATTSSTTVPDFKTLSAFHQRITNLEKDVKELKTVNHSVALLSTIKSEVPNVTKEYRGTSLDDALYKVIKKHDANIIKEHPVLAETIEKLKQQYVPVKSTKDIKKIKMEHARKQQDPKDTITSFDIFALKEFDQKTTLFQRMT
nr:hypothetical protein [Tanacetum cinerariifolium]